MTDRKGVLVRFPADVLADLDAEAKRSGKARMAIIVERCAWFKGRRASLAPDPEEARAFLAKKAAAPKPLAYIRPMVQVGPPVYTPGSRLKKR